MLCRAINRTRTYMFQLWKNFILKFKDIHLPTQQSSVQCAPSCHMTALTHPSTGKVFKKRRNALYAVLVEMQHINTVFDHSVRFLRGSFERNSPRMYLDFLRWCFERNALKSEQDSVSRPTLCISSSLKSGDSSMNSSTASRVQRHQGFVHSSKGIES